MSISSTDPKTQLTTITDTILATTEITPFGKLIDGDSLVEEVYDQIEGRNPGAELASVVEISTEQRGDFLVGKFLVTWHMNGHCRNCGSLLDLDGKCINVECKKYL